jgi:hypothetical protein
LNKRLLYRIAYRKLDNVTPLKTDCGQLCNKACCKGDQDTGMYLFPEEEAMYSPLPSFMEIKLTELFIGYENIKLAVCRGNCPRSLRPLSCRVFPLTPYIGSDGRLDIIIDPRAAQVCPIAKYGTRADAVMNASFTRITREVFRLLIKDNEIRAFVEYLSHILDEYLYLANTFK